ncbi:hypothetical protein CHS0354_038258 [Potamilus streckersoni]|uniref:Uncharacterized protein n=1 Tax=Potamilus streckersoni TaxID=2493646 RepID=A0AAE0RU45_9BIVA|nr:hypothetical protein CHS0354_038258 [Potamilus streckersoni]
MYRRFEIDLKSFVMPNIYERTVRLEGRISKEEAVKRLNSAAKPATSEPQVETDQDKNTPSTSTTEVNPVLTQDEIDIITSDEGPQIDNPLSDAKGEETRDLFNVESLTWETVNRKRRIRSLNENEDRMEISGNQ